jgi:hypothetical protein
MTTSDHRHAWGAHVVEQLTDNARARTPEQFLATGGTGLRTPGLYSWWVDRSGADHLTHGLGHPVGPG